MHGRFDTATRRLLHWSEPAFTVSPAAGEEDHAFAGPVTLPGPLGQLRATADWTGLETDPALVPAPPRRGLACVRVLHTQLDGVDDAAKWARGKDLRIRHPEISALVDSLSYDEILSPTRLDIAKTAFAVIKAMNILSTAEISRIESFTPVYGFSLTLP